jgi:hypothetical protein
VTVGLKDVRSRRVIPATGTFPPSNVRRAETTDRESRTSADAVQSSRTPGRPMIIWDHIISPDESEAIVGQLAAFPEVKAYKAGRSYRGRDI